MAGQPYPNGTFPVQFIGGGIKRAISTPNSTGGPFNPLTGGTVFAGGTPQNNKLFDSTLGILGWPYQGIRNSYNDNKPYQNLNLPYAGFGITKALAGGTFAKMAKGQYIILTFASQIAGVQTNVLQSPGSSYRKSQNLNIGWVDTVLINKTGGWYVLNGLPVNPINSRDSIGVESYPGSYANPGRFIWLSSGKLPTVQSYATKND